MWLFLKINELFIHHLKRQCTFLTSLRKSILFYFCIFWTERSSIWLWRHVATAYQILMHTPRLLFPLLHCEISAPHEVYFKRVCKSSLGKHLQVPPLEWFPLKEKRKNKKFSLPCLPSTSITEARHSDCYLFGHNYYHETSMITALVILLIINSTNAVIHQQRLAALAETWSIRTWMVGPWRIIIETFPRKRIPTWPLFPIAPINASFQHYYSCSLLSVSGLLERPSCSLGCALYSKDNPLIVYGPSNVFGFLHLAKARAVDCESTLDSALFLF